MKRLAFLFALAIVALSALAQTPADSVTAVPVRTIADHIADSGTGIVSQPAALNERLRPAAPDAEDAAGSAAQRSTGGYRIQVYSGNNAHRSQGEARARAAAISASFPEHATYVTFDAPYWRLKVGDFRNYEDASAALSVMKAQFPAYAREMRLVRSKINISNL